jgi:hypothetical protein
MASTLLEAGHPSDGDRHRELPPPSQYSASQPQGRQTIEATGTLSAARYRRVQRRVGGAHSQIVRGHLNPPAIRQYAQAQMLRNVRRPRAARYGADAVREMCRYGRVAFGVVG